MPDDPILILEHSRDLARLYQQALQEAEFAVEALVYPDDVVREVRERQPAVVVLDVLPVGDRSLATLTQLRADQVARDVPVIVLTTNPELAESVVASYNVRTALVKPFDLDALVNAVREQVGYPTMHARIPDEATPPEGFMEDAERALARRSFDIAFRWIQRLRAEAPWRDRDDLGLADLVDHVPIVLKTLDVRLHYVDPAGFFERHADALERVGNHARLRRRQGIALEATLREYALLREEVWITLQRSLPARVEPEEFFQVERAINGTLDAIIVATAAEFLGEEHSAEHTSLPS